ncbi:hypothetical protein GCM10023085_11870 [Actinomadura viridis]|uniref:CDP-glycerol:poly(Glycerophosphate) glycerophosphotransferase n=1 Tax=Actinomadura viridis TaxID=58110 RepID=A0A931DPR3_9ACTN|nr:hypothetical protein [Actinomadura viridis]MBG6093562.1 hypothetical protein [Actinomadura viridis]
MSSDGWSPGPFGLDAAKGATLATRRTVLAVAHHLTAATRLADVLTLIERDRRVQTVYTVAPASVFSPGVADHLRAAGALVIPFDRAAHTSFDLAIAAGDGGLERLHAPVLLLQHGMGPATRSHRWAGAGPAAPRPIAGLRREALVAGGRVIPAVIALAHHEHRLRLARICPEAEPAVRVVGDPALDRIGAGAPSRETYRRALGVGGRRLVVVSSTWGPRSLFGRHRDLIRRLATELPPERYAVVAALHPATWSWHGHRQCLAWFDDCRRLGAGLLPPHEGWQAALTAADLVVGDYGSVSHYAAAIGVPTVLAAFPDDDVLPGSQAELLGRLAPRLSLDRPLLPQIEAHTAAHSAPAVATLLRDRLTSEPGRAAALLRREMYGLLRLAEPAEPAALDAVPPPRLVGTTEPEVVR